MSYQELGNAIIKQAYMDLVWSMRMTPPYMPNYKKSAYEKAKKKKMRDECMEFFESDWYETLTTVDSTVFLNMAYTEKAKSRVYEWLRVLDLNERRRCYQSKKIDWRFKVTDNRIKDKRYFEYKKRVRARKKRIKEQEKKR